MLKNAVWYLISSHLDIFRYSIKCAYIWRAVKERAQSWIWPEPRALIKHLFLLFSSLDAAADHSRT